MRELKNTNIRTLVSAAAILLASVSVAGCSSKVESKSVPASLEAKAQPVVLRFDSTPARRERGKYLVENAMHCFSCHSEINWKAPGGPPVEGKAGAGKDWKDYGLPFVTAPNLTPDRETGSGNWTDQMWASAIREGKGHDGRALFPLMPFMNYRSLSDEDLASVVSYLRSLKPVRNKLRATELPAEIKESLPPHMPITESVPEPDLADPVKRGAYLVAIGECSSCHTPRNQKGEPLPGLEFGGGELLKGPWGEAHSANLTSDSSGISYYDEAQFLKTIRTGQVGARKLNSIMPWGYLRNMTDDDLKAVFAYLRTLKPVKHVVDNTEKPTFCKVCGQRHGFGDRN